MSHEFVEAKLETRKFEFTAYGNDAREAKSALIQSFGRHAREYEIPVDWWKEFADDIQLKTIELGVGYRDGQPF